jgi:hypothetical protein
MPAIIITKPRAANTTERATGACTSSPSRVRPVACTRELPFTFALRAPARAPRIWASRRRRNSARTLATNNAPPSATTSSRITSS